MEPRTPPLSPRVLTPIPAPQFDSANPFSEQLQGREITDSLSNPDAQQTAKSTAAASKSLSKGKKTAKEIHIGTGNFSPEAWKIDTAEFVRIIETHKEADEDFFKYLQKSVCEWGTEIGAHYDRLSSDIEYKQWSAWLYKSAEKNFNLEIPQEFMHKDYLSETTRTLEKITRFVPKLHAYLESLSKYNTVSPEQRIKLLDSMPDLFREKIDIDRCANKVSELKSRMKTA
jgi:hypothetical protein